MEFLQYALALIVTLGILVTFHEAGHFIIAKASGVKVIRFSVGFGRPILSWHDRAGTEYAIAWLPLGGYVRMLDEREADVPPEDAHRSFNRLTPAWRIAIAFGGPLANFLLAIIVYWGLFVAGSTDFVPIVDAPAAETPAYSAGLRGGEEIVAIDDVTTAAWPQVTMALAARLGDSGFIRVTTREPGGDATREHRLSIDEWQRGVDEPELLDSLGLRPTLPALVGNVLPDGPAASAGFEAWDRVVSVGGQPITDWSEWVDAVRALPGQDTEVVVMRGGVSVPISLRIGERTDEAGSVHGYVGVSPLVREVSYSPLGAVPRALSETWDKTVLTLDLLKKMVTGLVSTRNLSGPITIAKVAGDSARSGFESFFGILALLSISLGVLNLLPIPILDGGHIVLCTTEMVIRRPIPERVQAWGVQIGLAIVGGMMVLAVYNDISRLFLN